MNKVIIMGRLGKDPEISYTQHGKAVCNFSVATSDVYYDKEKNKQEKTEWHRIVLFGAQAENAHKYLGKGSQVLLEGKIQSREWENKEGQKVRTTEILASSVTFLNRKQSDNSSTGSNETKNDTFDTGFKSTVDKKFSETFGPQYTAEDLPF